MVLSAELSIRSLATMLLKVHCCNAVVVHAHSYCNEDVDYAIAHPLCPWQVHQQRLRMKSFHSNLNGLGKSPKSLTMKMGGKRQQCKLRKVARGYSPR